MEYPGNPSLSPEIRERILSTYQQTLDLAAQGNRQEASLGCDFILRMDADFQPARSLLERLDGGQGTVDVEDLRPGQTGFLAGSAHGTSAQRTAEADELFAPEEAGGLDELQSLDLDLGEPAAAATPGDRTGEYRRLFEERRLEELLTRARSEASAVEADPELGRIVEAAQSLHEAAPYVASFLDAAGKALELDDRQEAESLLTKARQLDPDHPGLRRLEAQLSGAPSPPPASGAETAWDKEATSPALDLGHEGSLDADTDQRITELLSEGQAAFDRGELQDAIDAWSRIFLIDIDHREASRRIEEARKLKAERERKVEEIFHGGVESLEQGNQEEARTAFEKVLELQPGHLLARDYIEQLDSGRTPVVGSSGAAAEKVAPAPAEPLELDREADRETPLKHEILVPPEPGETRAVPPPPPAVAGGPRKRPGRSLPGGRKFLLISGAVLVVVLAAAWFVYQNRSRVFPNAADTPPAAAPQETDPIARATRLHDAGRTALAIQQLRHLPPSDARYEEAQALVSQWQAEEGPSQPVPDGASGTSSGPSGPELTRRNGLLDEARGALEHGENLQASEAFADAAAIAPLSDHDSALRDQAEKALEPLRSQIDLVRGGDWEYALRELWRRHTDQPDNPDVRQLLVNSYYNLGVRDLQRGSASEAADNFKEALGLDPGEPTLRRCYLFARTYENREQDLLYQIYVKYLPFR